MPIIVYTVNHPLWEVCVHIVKFMYCVHIVKFMYYVNYPAGAWTYMKLYTPHKASQKKSTCTFEHSSQEWFGKMTWTLHKARAKNILTYCTSFTQIANKMVGILGGTRPHHSTAIHTSNTLQAGTGGGGSLAKIKGARTFTLSRKLCLEATQKLFKGTCTSVSRLHAHISIFADDSFQCCQLWPPRSKC